MTAAYRIWSATGWQPQVYEAQEVIGGRTRTIRGLPGGQHAEGGGSFISSGDRAIRGLVDAIGLELVDLNDDYPGGRVAYHFRGESHRGSRVFDDQRETARNARRHFKQIPWPATYRNKNARTEKWDRMSVAEWIDSYTPRGLSSLYGRYLKVYFETEYAGSIHDASALHLIADFAAPGRNYDERYVMREGSDAIVARLEELLPAGSVVRNMPLVALRATSSGYALTFGNDGSTAEVTADRVVLALPFAAFQDVDYSAAGISTRMDRAIRNLGMGRNTKITLLFNKAQWEPDFSGDSYSDLITGVTWPGHPGQPGKNSQLVCFNGAPFASSSPDAPVHGPAPAEVIDTYLSATDAIWPRASQSFTGDAYIDRWPADSWIKGSYSYYPTGGFTDFAGIEGRAQGGIHFAGEHTAGYDNRGLMNGAVASGKRAAREIIAALAG